ncbi:tigger transposable element-derived protein 6-like [Bactrocera neohumeralis]|uniref:tigger transposable element-derived protein 6-like n=1 Tax=Bactrocera neohumeralis TaxID=98809 RepID=UPI0021650A2C|nr:tigger transposable element-derived protein 6-like [Bactrocera neohumeralis]
MQTEFLPPNTTSVLQPLDKGIIKSFKTLYRKEVVVKLLESIEEKKDYFISIYDAMNIAHKAWTNISKSTIKNCFRACGFVKDQNVVVISEDVLHISEWARVPQNSETRVNFDDYIHFDDELVITGSLNDDEILGFENIDDENDETFEIPSVSTKVAKASIENLRLFFMASNVEDTIFNDIVNIDNAIDKIRQNNVRQKHITDFF